MSLFYILLVLLLVTRIFGEIAHRFGQPVLVGELIAGVVLGIVIHGMESKLPILSELHHNQVFEALTDLAIFFLMLLAGIEMRPEKLKEASRGALIVAVGGMALPMALGLMLGWVALPASDWKAAQMLYLGVALSVTAVPITVAALMDLGQQQSRVGTVIVTAAVFDDLFSLFLLAVLTAALNTGGQFSLAALGWLSIKVVVFFLVVTAGGRYAFPWLGNLTKRLHMEHIEFTSLILWALAFAVLAELLGLHFILGAYAAGLFFRRNTIDVAIHEELFGKIETFTLGFFAPLFFASIGISVDLRAITEIPLFLAALIVAAFVGKTLGSGLAARGCGMSARDAAAVGVGMNARGAVELVVAGIALNAGLFTHPDNPPAVVTNLFSAVVLMAICAAVLSPIALRLVLGKSG